MRDVVRAYRLLIESGSLGEVYHVASSQAHSIQSVLDILLSMGQVSISVKEAVSRMRPSVNHILVGSIEKLVKQTGWKARISFEDSLRDILEYWRTQV